MLYKRAFRKEKEVITFLIKDKMIKSACTLRITSLLRKRGNRVVSSKGQALCSLPTGTGKTLVQTRRRGLDMRYPEGTGEKE